MLKLIWFYFFSVTLLLSLSFADNSSPVLTNDDLIKYKSASDNKSPSQMQYRPQPYIYEENRADQADYESWCSSGIKYRNKVDRAKNELKEAEEKFRIEKNEYEIYNRYKSKSGKPSKYHSAESRLENARKHLAEVELELSELESQAHRKGVKPGWLRCQK